MKLHWHAFLFPSLLVSQQPTLSSNLMFCNCTTVLALAGGWECGAILGGYDYL